MSRGFGVDSERPALLAPVSPARDPGEYGASLFHHDERGPGIAGALVFAHFCTRARAKHLAFVKVMKMGLAGL